jgi:spore coat polysaccharide biosynthesis protein SpsF (cytidylyltransferase family)
MNYPIPANPQEVVALRQKPVSEELIAAAIAGVVQVARLNGQSLDDLMAEVMAEDALLDVKQRSYLSQIVATAWENLP